MGRPIGLVYHDKPGLQDSLDAICAGTCAGVLDDGRRSIDYLLSGSGRELPTNAGRPVT